MQPQHCAQAAALHLAYLKSSFRKVRPARELLTLYYRAVCQEVGATGFVAYSQGSVDGYICGVWDARALRRRMIQNSLPGLTVWTLLLLLQQPMLLAELPTRVLGSNVYPPPSRPGIPTPGYELRPIVVSEAKRGSGIAELLVQALLQDAAARGFAEVYLITESDNLAAIKFYSRIGFSRVGETVRHGLMYQLYAIPTGANA